MRQTTVEKRLTVVINFANGKSYHEIAKIINRNVCTVQYFAKRHESKNRISNKSRKA